MDNVSGNPPPPGVQWSQNYPSVPPHANFPRPPDQSFYYHPYHQFPVQHYGATPHPHGQGFPRHFGPPSQYNVAPYSQISCNDQYGNGTVAPTPPHSHQAHQYSSVGNSHGAPYVGPETIQSESGSGIGVGAVDDQQKDTKHDEKTGMSLFGAGTSGPSSANQYYSSTPTGGDVSSETKKFAQADDEIESVAQAAMLREQENAMQRVIQSQREVREASMLPDDKDIFAGQHDPNAIKEHLLKLTAEHRSEMAVKRGKPSALGKKDNLEIGNGYGVPGGGAYDHSAFPGTSGVSGSEINKISAGPGPEVESQQKQGAKELPDFLKQRLRARGILKDASANNDHPVNVSKQDTQVTQLSIDGNLARGWVEAKDPERGLSYYYNEISGKTQWERPVETNSISQSQSSSDMPEDWVETLDDTSGQKYYFNKKTQVSQWERPHILQQVTSEQVQSATSNNLGDIWGEQSSLSETCLNCGGWGLGLVQAWGYCNHCTRTLELPQSQYLFQGNKQQSDQDTNATQETDRKFPPQRSGSRPPINKGGGRFNKKRAHGEDDELDPMDPSSYSDAPRGGWALFSNSGPTPLQEPYFGKMQRLLHKRRNQGLITQQYLKEAMEVMVWVMLTNISAILAHYKYKGYEIIVTSTRS